MTNRKRPHLAFRLARQVPRSAFPWGSPQLSVSGNRNRPQPSVAAAPGRHRHVVNTFGIYRAMEAPCRYRMLPRLNYRFTVSAAPC
jgi:hypothetical protein